MKRVEELHSFIEIAMESWNCPGVALAVLQGEDILHQSACGLRDVESRLAMTEDTRFPMASITKSLTAMTVALLVDEGKLDWDKPVREYLPEFILSDPYASQHVTVRDMLSHRTGLPRHDLAVWRLDIPREEFIKQLCHLEFNGSFREKFQYNNLMYYATAHLVETIAKKRWEDFVEERIFHPLGMKSSSLKPLPPTSHHREAIGYRLDRDEEGDVLGLIPMPLGEYTDLSPGSAGALFSTLKDMQQWLQLHLNGGKTDNIQIVSENSLSQMHLPQTVVPGDGISEALLGNTIYSYGMGWFIEPYRGYTLVHHGGNLEGHSLTIGFVPQKSIGVIVLTNLAVTPLSNVLIYEALDRALDLPNQNWNERFHKVYDPLIKAESQGKTTSKEERLKEAPATHPLKSYTGTFEARGYPDFKIRLNEESLQASLFGSLPWSELRHYHYNIFEWHLEDFEQWIKVQFQIDEQGEISGITVPLEPEVEDISFNRKQLVLSDSLIASLIGHYNPPIDGLSFTITAQKNRVYLNQSNEPPVEIKPYRLDEEVIGFRWERTRLDFLRENLTIKSLMIKTPSATLEAPRVEEG